MGRLMRGCAVPLAALLVPAWIVGIQSSWTGVLFGGALGLALVSLGRARKVWPPLRVLWSVLLGAYCGGLCRLCFPGEGTPWLIVGVLFALAAWTLLRGEAFARMAAILAVLLAAMCAVVVACLLPDCIPSYIIESTGIQLGWQSALLVILWAGVLRETKELSAPVLLFGVMLLGSLVSGGVLGRLQLTEADPVNALARAANVFGKPARLEALVSVILCIGLYCAVTATLRVGYAELKRYDRFACLYLAILAAGLSLLGNVSGESMLLPATACAMWIPSISSEKNRRFLKKGVDK